MLRIIPSLASADPLNYRDFVSKLDSNSSLHLDIEDGNFLPNITFGMKTIQFLSKETTLSLNAHLEVTNPLFYIPDLIKCGIKEIAVHIESLPYPLQALNLIRDLGGSPGLAFNLSTPPEIGEIFFQDVDFILLMTSEADSRNQDFYPSSINKIKKIRHLLPSSKNLWVDGGITEDLLPDVKKAGADTIIMGRAIVFENDPAKKIHLLSQI